MARTTFGNRSSKGAVATKAAPAKALVKTPAKPTAKTPERTPRAFGGDKPVAAPSAPARRALPPRRELQLAQQRRVEPVQPDPEKLVEEETPDNPSVEVVEGAEDNTQALAILPQLMSAPMGALQGEVQNSDFKIPELKLAQSVGPLTEELGFKAGQLVLKNELLLRESDAEYPLVITVLKASKYFVEYVEYGSDVMPRIFNTMQEAADAGLETQWVDRNPPEVSPALTCLLLIESPFQDVSPEFSYEYDGRSFTIAIWRVGSTAYREAGVKIIGESRQRLALGLHTGAFELTAKKVKGKVNSYWVPALKNGEMHDEAFVNQILEWAGATPVPTE